MYTLAVRRSFIARHALVGGDWGRENDPNSHRYLLELRLSGQSLNAHGFLVDIVDVERHLDSIVAKYRDSMLNDLPEFRGLNPSLEHFARILAEAIAAALRGQHPARIEVVLWEDDAAWASFDLPA